MLLYHRSRTDARMVWAPDMHKVQLCYNGGYTRRLYQLRLSLPPVRPQDIGQRSRRSSNEDVDL